jgi:hypothetical protein
MHAWKTSVPSEIILVADPADSGSSPSCTLDPNWSGLWYTNGNRQPLLLNMSTFETKGRCAANVGNNKYVFHLKTYVIGDIH